MLRKMPLLCLLFVLALAIGCSNNFDPVLDDQQRTEQASKLALNSGGTLASATFYIYVIEPSGQQVNIHRITSGWDEMLVTWNNFGGAYAADIEGSFMADASDWRSVDVTALVQEWMNGVYENFGLLIDQEIIDYPRAIYGSRENASLEPYLEICYTDAAGAVTCEQIPAIADAFINEYRPDENNGYGEALFTGWAADVDFEKQSLIRFELPVEPPEEGCTHTIGYWKTHAGFGPQNDVVTPLLPIWLGDPGGEKSLEITTAGMAVDILKMKTYGKPSNGITKLYAQLLGAKLSVVDGAGASAVSAVITEADAFLADYDWHDWKSLGEFEKFMVNNWQGTLDDYNNGLIGPGHCDDFDTGDDDGDDNDDGAPPSRGRRGGP